MKQNRRGKQKKRRKIESERDHFINKTQVGDKELADAQKKEAAERSAREETEKEAERLRREAQDAKLQQTSAERDRERAEKVNLQLILDLERQKKVHQLQQQRQHEKEKHRSSEEVAGGKESSVVTDVSPILSRKETWGKEKDETSQGADVRPHGQDRRK